MNNSPLQSHKIPENSKPQFLNTLAPVIFKYIASKEKAKKAIASGEILVNGNKVASDAKVFSGDVISLNKREQQVASKGLKKVFKEKIEVVFEDEHMAILNKPGGIPVNGNQFKTLENTLPFNLKPTKERDALPIMRPLHRLDEPTCGLVLVAKTERAQVVMGQQFEQKTIRKRYKAVVIGKPQNKAGNINTPIEGKECLTEYEVVKTTPSVEYGFLSLVNLFPVTGRTHQLRIHFSELGHPVVGDKYYSKAFKVLDGKGLMLCSDKVWFNHPITEKAIEVEIEIPNKFTKYMEREAFMAKKK